MYSNVKRTDTFGIVLEFSCRFWKPALLLFTLCKCDIILVGSFVLIYKGTLLNSVRLELDLERFVQREINVRYCFVPRLF